MTWCADLRNHKCIIHPLVLVKGPPMCHSEAMNLTSVGAVSLQS